MCSTVKTNDGVLEDNVLSLENPRGHFYQSLALTVKSLAVTVSVFASINASNDDISPLAAALRVNFGHIFAEIHISHNVCTVFCV